MALLELDPDNTEIDRQLRKYGIDPARISRYPVIDPNTIDPDCWDVREYGPPWYLSFGVIGRPREMTYDYGTPIAMSAAMSNSTNDPIVRTLTGTQKIGTETSFSVSAKIDPPFLKVLSVSVTASFSRVWKKEETFTDSVTATIHPGRIMWLELKPVIRRMEGDFIFFMRCFEKLQHARRFSGIVEAPGIEGGLKDVINVRDEPISGVLADVLKTAASGNGSSPFHTPFPVDGGTVTLPGFLASLLAGGESAPGKGATV